MRVYVGLTNRVEEKIKYYDIIEVGTLATVYLLTDRDAYEVIKVNNQNDVVIRMLKAIRIDDNGPYSECQEYRFESDVNGYIKRIKKNKKGKWNVVFTYIDINGKEKVWRKEPISIRFGVADKYFDYSF